MDFEAKEILFHEFINVLSIKYPYAPALTYNGQTMNYTDLRVMSDRCSILLRKAGVKKGDKVAIWGYNSSSWVVTFLGITGAGAVAGFMNYALKADDITALLKSIDASWMVLGNNTVSMQSEEKAVEAAANAGIPKDRIIKMSDLINECTTMELYTEDMDNLFEIRSEIKPRDTQLIIFTTGTSSFPKAAQLSSYSCINDARCFAEYLFRHGKREDSGILIALPMFHSFGLLMLLFALTKGNHIYLPVDFMSDSIIKILGENQVSDMVAVGAIYGRLIEHPDFDAKVAGKMRYCVVGGSFSTKAMFLRYENAFCGTKFLNGYGQTETSPMISVGLPGESLDLRATRVGHPLPGLDVRIWSKEKGFLPAGEEGEIVVKGYNVMNGYYGLPEESQPFDEDGYLHTQDLGVIDEEGFLQITGRIKDIIIRCGENISPSEIEMILMEDENLTAVKVMGAPHSEWGESVEACIVVRDEGTFDEEATKAKLKSRIASFKIPSHFFIYSGFPYNSNEKLDQRSLRDDMMKRLNVCHMQETLVKGIQILSLSLNEQIYSVSFLGPMVRGLMKEFKYDDQMCDRVTREMKVVLGQQVLDAEQIEEDVRIKVVLMPDVVRISFTTGMQESVYEATKKAPNVSAVPTELGDRNSVNVLKNGEVEYCIDYRYPSDFRAVEFLVKAKA